MPVVDGCDDEILQHFDVVLRHNLGINLDREELLGAVDRHRHHAAAGGGFDGERRHFFLQAFLPLLRLLHHLLNLLGIHISSTSRISAGKTSSSAWTPASASASSFNADFRSASPAFASPAFASPPGAVASAAKVSATTVILRP